MIRGSAVDSDFLQVFSFPMVQVLGASVAGIATLLSKDFLMLVLLSFAFAAPVAWFSMYKWLQGYSYRVSIEWWVFAHPVASLRSE